MTLQKGYLDELQARLADPRIGFIVGELLESIVTRLSKHIDVPARLFASTPADAKLNIGSNGVDGTVVAGDGAGKVSQPISALNGSLVATTIDFQVGTIVGGTVTYQGSAFTIPLSTTGKFRIFVFALQKDGSVAVNYGAEQTSFSSLEDPGSLVNGLGGTPIGYLKVVATASTTPGKYKTASSGANVSATSIIEDAPNSVGPAVFRYLGGGGGSGGGGGAGLVWTPTDGSGAAAAQENGDTVYLFPLAGTAQLVTTMKVPKSYSAGSPISLYLSAYSPDVTGTILVSTTAFLVRKGVDSFLAPPNSRASTNTTVNLATIAVANVAYEVVCDLTDTAGKINGVAVNPGDDIRIVVTRGSDSGASDVRFVPAGTNPTFS